MSIQQKFVTFHKVIILISSYFPFSWEAFYQPLKRQPNKMIKHTQTIRFLLATNCLNVFDQYVVLALKGLTYESDSPLRGFPNSHIPWLYWFLQSDTRF